MSDKNFHLTCKDHLVSGEEFQLQNRSDFEILETIPKPENLSAYYESENYISHTDSSKTITDKIYQAVKNFMLLQKLKWINKVAKGNNLLDNFLLICFHRHSNCKAACQSGNPSI